MRPVMAFIKKNLMSLICAVVALGAIIAVFWPISGYYTALQTLVDARKAAYAAGTGLLHKPRTLPVLDPLSTDPEPLNVFPTDAVNNRGTLAQKAIHDESQEMLDTATKLVAHQPLVPDALPDGGTIEATDFLRKYQQMMTWPFADPNNQAGGPNGVTGGQPFGTGPGGAPGQGTANDQPQSAPPGTILAILHAGIPPSDAQIKARQDDLKNQITQQKTEKDASGAPINAAQVEAEVESAVDEVPTDMRNNAALQNQMYVAPGAFHINPSLTGVNAPTTVSMFNGQVGLWLLQDVFSALASANADTTGGVPGARVKHLIKIDFADDPFGKPAYTSDPNQPAVPPSDPLHPTLALTQSPTGHVSNGLYDVVPFNLQIVVDSQELPAVLAALSKDRFITVLRMDLLTVDSGSAVLAGYLYGKKPVVQLNLSCEELFFRNDTGPYMPDAIKKALGIAPPPGAPGAPPTAAP